MLKKKARGSADLIDLDDAPPLTPGLLESAEVFDGVSFVRRGPGRPRSGTAREQISVRLDADLLARLREAGPGWQSHINKLLRGALKLDASDKV